MSEARQLSIFDPPSKEQKLTQYRHQAWRTRNRQKAERIARIVGGVMVLYNPVADQMKVIGA